MHPNNFVNPIQGIQSALVAKCIAVDAYGGGQCLPRPGIPQAGAVAFVDKKDLDSASLRQVIEDTLR